MNSNGNITWLRHAKDLVWIVENARSAFSTIHTKSSERRRREQASGMGSRQTHRTNILYSDYIIKHPRQGLKPQSPDYLISHSNFLISIRWRNGAALVLKKMGTYRGYPHTTGIETYMSLFILRHSRLAAPFKLLQPRTCLHQKYTKARDHMLPFSLPGKTSQHTTSFHLTPEFLVTRCNQLLVDVHIRIQQLSPISY